MKISFKSDLFSGLATAMFGIPGGMAYAKLAGVNPIYGLFSGMIPTIVSSLTTSSVLMLSTLTSAIAISTRSVLDLAGVESHYLPQALFTLTFLIGVFMLVLGLLRLGRIVDYVSNAVMTGFVVGVSLLVIVGELSDLVGIADIEGRNTHVILNWVLQIADWDPFTSAVGFGSVILMFLFQIIPKLKEVSSLLVLFIFTLVVNLQNWPVSLVEDISAVPGRLPDMVIPDFSLIPRLALGAVSIALVAFTQGAGISSATRNPDGSDSDRSQDLIGEGLGNIAGSFFQSLGTGGSLSRTGISIETGAKSRMAGVFAGLWLMGIMHFFGHLVQLIPLASIAGILCVIAAKIIIERIPDIKLIVKTSPVSAFVMLVTFLSALVIPLQWTIFLGAGMSLLFFAYTSSTEIRLYQWVRDEEGYFITEKIPEKMPSNHLMILDYEGNCFFGEVPQIKKLMPSIKGVHDSAIIWRMRGCEDVHSTFLKWLKGFVEEFHKAGNLFILEGVEPHAMKQLEKTGMIELLGHENVFKAEPGIFRALEKAIKFTNQWMNGK